MHVAIIPDGNRRWAKARGLPGTRGHAEAVRRERLRALLEEAIRLGITHLSLWAFSTENWKRSKAEVTALFGLLDESIDGMRPDAEELGVHVRWIGRRDRIPARLRERLEGFERETAKNRKLHFLLYLDYGGRDEILRAIRKARGKDLDAEAFSALLDTGGMPDPDLIIRTSGEYRLSGFMPWQAVYAELYFIEKHFPDFSPDDLREAVGSFRKRERRFGGNA